MVAYGYQVAGNDDPLVQMLDDAFRIGGTTTASMAWVCRSIQKT